MHWLADYWWVVLIILIADLKRHELRRLDHKKFLSNKPLFVGFCLFSG
ncbi:YpfN family protein [Yersinia enterocolitica subsp. palearctica]|nr:YpfN family protein [Yersinia enterocolitica subsp. palearctica]